MEIQLSTHFTLAEIIASDYAARQGFDNTPTPEILAHLKLLCLNLLERERQFFNLPIIVTSGYRSLVVNTGIGGASKSQHMTGDACDHHVLNMSDEDVVRKLYYSQIPYDQLILEFPPNGWVHISRSNKPRRQTLIATRGTDGKTVYEPYMG